MPYIPVTKDQKEGLLRKIGVKKIEDLFSDIPADLRFPELGIGEGLSEQEVLRELSELSRENVPKDGYSWFLGAGAYDHFIPAVVPYLASRGEFVSAYTPYQPEVSQGTLQAIFEYQSMIAELTGLDVVNAGHYDGACALAEAVLMGLRKSEGRGWVLLPAALHPEYQEVIRTYLSAFDAKIKFYSGDPAAAANGVLATSGGEAAANAISVLVAAYPDFYGKIPDLSGAAEAVHRGGGLFVVHADPVMLGLFKSPGAWGADVVTAEGQSLGNDLNYGGPYLGIMAAKISLVRRLPGRIVGQATDSQGKRGFVLTLVAREQHIRREKAVSNICSNQGVAALRTCVHLAVMGKAGLKAAAELCWHRAHYAASRIAKIPGFSIEEGLFFKEFLVHTPVNAEQLGEKLYDKKIICGLPLSRYFPERTHELLVCVTEKNTRTDIDKLVEALREASL